jgi:hypothetical protein
MVMLIGDLERLYATVVAAIVFGSYAIWQRALLHCRDAAVLASTLKVNPRLQEDERTTLAQGAEALGAAQVSIKLSDRDPAMI